MTKIEFKWFNSILTQFYHYFQNQKKKILWIWFLILKNPPLSFHYHRHFHCFTAPHCWWQHHFVIAITIIIIVTTITLSPYYYCHNHYYLFIIHESYRFNQVGRKWMLKFRFPYELETLSDLLIWVLITWYSKFHSD